MNTTQPTISFSFGEKSIVQASSRVAAVMSKMFKWVSVYANEEQITEEGSDEEIYLVEKHSIAYKALAGYSVHYSADKVFCNLYGDSQSAYLENIAIPHDSLFNQDMLCCHGRASVICPTFKLEMIERHYHRKIKPDGVQHVVDRTEYVITVSLVSFERKVFAQHKAIKMGIDLVHTSSVLSLSENERPTGCELGSKFNLQGFNVTGIKPAFDFYKNADFYKMDVFNANGSIHVDIDKMYETIVAKKRKAEHIDPMYLAQHELPTSTNVCIVGRMLFTHTGGVLADLANALPAVKTPDQYAQALISASNTHVNTFMAETFRSLDGLIVNPELPKTLNVSFNAEVSSYNPMSNEQSFKLLSKEVELDNLAGQIELKTFDIPITLTTGETIEQKCLMFKITLNKEFNRRFLENYQLLKKSGVTYVTFSDVYVVQTGGRNRMLIDRENDIALDVAYKRISLVRAVVGTSDENFNKLPIHF